MQEKQQAQDEFQAQINTLQQQLDNLKQEKSKATITSKPEVKKTEVLPKQPESKQKEAPNKEIEKTEVLPKQPEVKEEIVQNKAVEKLESLPKQEEAKKKVSLPKVEKVILQRK